MYCNDISSSCELYLEFRVGQCLEDILGVERHVPAMLDRLSMAAEHSFRTPVLADLVKHVVQQAHYLLKDQ